MADFQESLRTVARDLFNLEINTVIKDNMTARKMPDPANAILDIAQTYATKLLELGVPLGYAFAEGDPDFQKPLKAWSKEAFSYDRLAVGDDTFGRLRWAAVAGQRGLENLAADDRIVVERITRNCDQLKSLLRRLEDSLKSAGIAGENRRSLNQKMVSTRSRSLLHLDPEDHCNEGTLVEETSHLVCLVWHAARDLRRSVDGFCRGPGRDRSADLPGGDGAVPARRRQHRGRRLRRAAGARQ